MNIKLSQLILTGFKDPDFGELGVMEDFLEAGCCGDSLDGEAGSAAADESFSASSAVVVAPSSSPSSTLSSLSSFIMFIYQYQVLQ